MPRKDRATELVCGGVWRLVAWIVLCCGMNDRVDRAVAIMWMEDECSFVEHRNYKIVYRRYASLFFLVGVDNDENELAILEFIHLLVETMDRHFGNVCELDIMFHLEKAHFMLEEMVMNGCIVETSKTNVLAPIQLMDKAS
ncbi:AP-4 complex subunit sigma-like protein [Drosera capensis]